MRSPPKALLITGSLVAASLGGAASAAAATAPPRIAYYPIDGSQVVRGGSGYPCPFGGCDLTVTNNLGSSATVFLGKPTY
jgi:hypothetical protein